MNSIKAVFVTSLLVSGCLPRHFNRVGEESDASPKLMTGTTPHSPQKVTYGFTWTGSAVALQNPRAYLEAGVSDAQRLNSTWTMTGNHAANSGHGVYLAADPISSRAYGPNLVIVPIKPNSAFKVINYSSTNVIRDNSTWGVLYSYGSFMHLENGDRFFHAAVLRNMGLVDDSVKPLSISDANCKPLDFSRLKFVPNQKWLDLLKSNSGSICNLNEIGEIFSTVDYRSEDPMSVARVYMRNEALLVALAPNGDHAPISKLPTCKIYGSDTRSCIRENLRYAAFIQDNTLQEFKDIVEILKILHIVGPQTNLQTVAEMRAAVLEFVTKKDIKKVNEIKLGLQIVRDILTKVENESMLTWK